MRVPSPMFLGEIYPEGLCGPSGPMSTLSRVRAAANFLLFIFSHPRRDILLFKMPNGGATPPPMHTHDDPFTSLELRSCTTMLIMLLLIFDYQFASYFRLILLSHILFRVCVFLFSPLRWPQGWKLRLKT